MGNEQAGVDDLRLLYIQLRSNEKGQCSEQYQKFRNNVIVLSELCQTKFDIVPNFIRVRGQKLSGTSASLLIDSCARTSAS